VNVDRLNSFSRTWLVESVLRNGFLPNLPPEGIEVLRSVWFARMRNGCSIVVTEEANVSTSSNYGT